MKTIFHKPTLFLIIGTLIIGIGVPSGIYGLTLTGGASLGGALILVGVAVVFVIVLIDRFLVRQINNRKLSIYETILLTIFIAFSLFKSRTLEIEQLNPNSQFLIVIENNGKLKEDKSEYKFPFNAKIKTNREFVIYKNIPDDIDITVPKGWNNSYYYNVYNYKNYPKVVLFAKDENRMDSTTILNYIEQNVK